MKTRARTIPIVLGRPRPRGFTLIEIGIVITIIGLLMSFILVVSMQGIENAKESATSALIAKLDTLVQDRLEVLLSRQVNTNLAHQFLANPQSLDQNRNILLGISGFPPPSARADVIARVDYVRAEMPDVFYIQTVPTSATAAVYPFNFAGMPYSYLSGSTQGINGLTSDPFVLPLGNAMFHDPTNAASGPKGAIPYYPGATPPFQLPPGYSPTGIGIYGASYGMIGALMKNLGTAAKERIGGLVPTGLKPQGYDGVDNDGNGLVDDFAEGVDNSNFNQVVACLNNHTHNTARSETLYAFLIESPGALVTRDSFKASEVGDTDGDGLPEFLDGWGNPIRFYRWPTHYHSDLQRGINPEGFDGIDNNGKDGVDYDGTASGDYAEAAVYVDVSENREINQLDPNNQLVSPVWWSDISTTPSYPGFKARVFQTMFFPLVEPLASSATIDYPPRWDRQGFFKRRNFHTKYLILSAGRDGKPGVFELDRPGRALDLVLFENTAAQHGTVQTGSAAKYALGSIGNMPNYGTPASGGLGQVPSQNTAETQDLIYAGQDDVTNHNLKHTGASAR
mgnify:CR=1 FL=1